MINEFYIVTNNVESNKNVQFSDKFVFSLKIFYFSLKIQLDTL